MSGRPGCSQYVGELAASVTIAGVVEMATVMVPVERFVPMPQCSECAVASECFCKNTLSLTFPFSLTCP